MPTALNTQILLGLQKPNFEVHVLPGTGHGLLESGTGLIDDEPRTSHLAHDLFPLIAAFLAKRRWQPGRAAARYPAGCQSPSSSGD